MAREVKREDDRNRHIDAKDVPKPHHPILLNLNYLLLGITERAPT